MIERYTPAAMKDHWNDRSKWERVLRVELATIKILAEDGIIPAEASEEIHQKADFDVQKIDEYEAAFKHDVIAFLTSTGDSLGDLKRFLHVGLTSYDVVDTALSLALKQAGELIASKLEEFRALLVEQAKLHQNTLMPGRTHGVHAELTTFGWKICGWIAEADRDIERLDAAIKNISVGKISGAVGTFPAISAEQEERICETLGLEVDPVSTQVISRDRHAEFLSTLAIIGGLLERIALEVRLLQHSEVEEILEPFSTKQRGSSAMPHKKNPVLCENLCGLARLLRNWAGAACENMALWHERDISHSSVERVVFPDATSIVYYMLERSCHLVKNWHVESEKMEADVKHDRGLMMSGQVLTQLKLVGIHDEDIYKRVQKHAMKARDTGRKLKDVIYEDSEIVDALGDKLDQIFDFDSVKTRSKIPFKRLGIE